MLSVVTAKKQVRDSVENNYLMKYLNWILMHTYLLCFVGDILAQVKVVHYLFCILRHVLRYVNF